MTAALVLRQVGREHFVELRRVDGELGRRLRAVSGRILERDERAGPGSLSLDVAVDLAQSVSPSSGAKAAT